MMGKDSRSREERFACVKQIVEKSYKDGTNSYAVWSTTYDKDTVDAEFQSPIFAAKKLAEVLGENKTARIIDFGAGTGRVAEGLHKSGFHNVDAVDPCKEMLDKARPKGLYKNIYCYPVSSAPTPEIDSEAYDAAVVSGAVAPCAMPIDSVLEFLRVVKKDGKIVIVMKIFEGSHSPSACMNLFQKLESEGKMKLIESVRVERYLYGEPGMVYHIQKS